MRERLDYPARNLAAPGRSDKARALREDRLREGGILGDVASTLLGMMGIAPPPEMTGRDLRIS